MIMTVKWTNEFDGVEKTRLFEAENVEVFYPMTVDGTFPEGTNHLGRPITTASLLIDAGANGEGYMLTSGRAYVMNTAGATVGYYVLGGGN